MLQEILKAATKDHHDELESLMFVNEIMNKTLTLQQYKTLLATNYIVHSTIEPELHAALDQQTKTRLCIGNRNKVDALAQDVKDMGLDKAELDAVDISFPTPAQQSNAAALGAMYVLEGATLGGHVINKKLKANPAFENLELHYYGVYGKELMPNWLAFVDILNTSVPEADYDLAKESAVKMFSLIAEVSKRVKAFIPSTIDV
jgi:heme oxygenase